MINDTRRLVQFKYKLKRGLDENWVGPFTVELNPRKGDETRVLWAYLNLGNHSNTYVTGVEITEITETNKEQK